ncbi:hypothetical protein [uncultured Modestobacter sp.]|uniref:hypothetical protein n=1 Tax=uncultured Modestobacter sp. TaxID=380048 RepID=UPI0026225DCA|nr:hypothetical protein [uncultured Modestobacter sp.]
MSTATLDADRPRTGAAPSAPSMLTLTRVELRKSTDTRAGRWLLIVIGLALLGVGAIALFVGNGPDAFADQFALTQLPIGVLLPVLGILLVTSEWSQRTAGPTFTLVPRRSRVLTAKVLAATVLAVLGVLAAALVAALTTALSPVVGNASGDWGLTGAQLGQPLLVHVAYVLSGVALGMLLLSSPLAIVLYFVLPTVFTLVSNLVSALSWVSDWLDLTVTTAPMTAGELASDGWPGVGTSVLLWVVLPMALGWARITRTEIA